MKLNEYKLLQKLDLQNNTQMPKKNTGEPLVQELQESL